MTASNYHSNNLLLHVSQQLMLLNEALSDLRVILVKIDPNCEEAVHKAHQCMSALRQPCN